MRPVPAILTRRALLAGGAVAASAAAAGAGQVAATDVLGRTVRLPAPARRIILGEGRMILVVGALDRAAPFGRVVGWRDDLITSDPDTWRQYRALDPAAARLPHFSGMRDGVFDVERAIALAADLILLNVEAKAAADARTIALLGGLGIAVAFIDFRNKPFASTGPSIRTLGRLLGRGREAEDIVAFRDAEIARVTERVAGAGRLRRPLVMLDRIPGYSDECCLSFGAENFGRMVEMAGGTNLGSRYLPGTFGTLDPEIVLSSDPDVVISTGGDFGAFQPGGPWIGLGPGADLAEARARLAALTSRPAFAGTRAVRDGRVHAIWHQFYNNPYQFVALQRIAKWLHPDLFADLDPEETFRALHARFMPVPYEPGYWVSLEKAS